jgi:hypothetical protein
MNVNRLLSKLKKLPLTFFKARKMNNNNNNGSGYWVGITTGCVTDVSILFPAGKVPFSLFNTVHNGPGVRSASHPLGNACSSPGRAS